MANMQRIRRVVYRHDWSHLAEWVRALDELADMSDEEIDEALRQRDLRSDGRPLQ